MSEKQIDFYIDFVSPFTYLAWVEFHKRLSSLEKTRPIQVNYIPVFLGAIYKAHGMTSPANVAAKIEYNKRDVQRWADFYSLKIQFPRNFPFNSLYVIKLIIAFQSEEKDKAKIRTLMDSFWTAIWQEGRLLDNWKSLEELLLKLEKNEERVKSLIAKANSPEIKEKLKKNNEEAVARGVFGVPGFFIEDELFWGNDRLDFVFSKLGSSSSSL